MSQATSEERTKVLEALRARKGVFERKGGGAVGALADEIGMTSQRLANVLPQLKNDGVELRREGSGAGVTAIVLDDVTSDDSRSGSPADDGVSVEEKPLTDDIKIDSSTEPQEKVDRICSLLEEAGADIAVALASRKEGQFCVDDVASAQGSLIEVLRRLALEAATTGRDNLLARIGSVSLAEVVDRIGREPIGD